MIFLFSVSHLLTDALSLRLSEWEEGQGITEDPEGPEGWLPHAGAGRLQEWEVA